MITVWRVLQGTVSSEWGGAQRTERRGCLPSLRGAATRHPGRPGTHVKLTRPFFSPAFSPALPLVALPPAHAQTEESDPEDNPGGSASGQRAADERWGQRPTAERFQPNPELPRQQESSDGMHAVRAEPGSATRTVRTHRRESGAKADPLALFTATTWAQKRPPP